MRDDARDDGWWNGFVWGIAIGVIGPILLFIGAIVTGYNWIFRCLSPNSGC